MVWASSYCFIPESRLASRAASLALIKVEANIVPSVIAIPIGPVKVFKALLNNLIPPEASLLAVPIAALEAAAAIPEVLNDKLALALANASLL